MKSNLIIVPILLLCVCVVSHARPISHAENPHNMSSKSANTVKALDPSLGGTEEICVFCHTPHSAAPKTPLWNRPDPEGPYGDGTFPIYATALIATDPGRTGYATANPEYPNGASRMCLSCHDGATSVGVLLGNQTISMESGLDTLSTSIDLSASHPISFNYNDDVIINVLDPADYRLPIVPADTPLDSAGQMQCTTCHDPHEDTYNETGTEFLPFWRSTGTGGGLYDAVCDACHITSPTSSSPPHSLP